MLLRLIKQITLVEVILIIILLVSGICLGFSFCSVTAGVRNQLTRNTSLFFQWESEITPCSNLVLQVMKKPKCFRHYLYAVLMFTFNSN